MDLEEFKQLVELDENIYKLKMKNISFEKRKKVLSILSSILK